MTLMSSHWHEHSCTTSKIRVLSVDSTKSRLIELLHYSTSPKSIFPSLLSGNQVIVTLTLTLTLIDRETSSLSGNWLIATLTLSLTKKPRETDNHDLVLLSLSLAFKYSQSPPCK